MLSALFVTYYVGNYEISADIFWPSQKFGRSSVQHYTLSETSVPTVCQKGQPKFCRTEISVYH